jgi:hypothetical protein
MTSLALHVVDPTATPIADPLPAAPAVALITEAPWERRLYLLAAMAVVIGFFIANAIYWVPAHPGVDQNGYLVGGRRFAENLTMRQAPQRPGTTEFDPYQFVGRMWVGADLGTPQERYYPKYPLGLPLVYAICLWIGGETTGPWLAYWVSPIGMTLGMAAAFFLIRQVSSSFWGLCGMLICMTSPVITGLADNPNSHATAVCCAVGGMALMFSWWQHGGRWRALIGGLLLGYAVTIRYTEALLLLPMVLVLLLNFRWRDRAWWWGAVNACVGWLVPVAILVAYNKAAMGHWTGYDGTNESAGFSVAYAADNWETVIRQLSSNGLFFIFPFSIVGLALMCWRQWRIGLVLGAWIVPSMLVYTFYYWAPDPLNANGVFVGYMRFFTTIFPPLLACACWLFYQSARWAAVAAGSRWAPAAAQGCAALVALTAIAVHLQNATFAAENDQVTRLMLKSNTDEVLAAAPEGSVIFTQSNEFLHHLQFLRNYALYAGETFNRSFVDNLPKIDPDEPQGWEPGRREALYARLKDKNQPQLDEAQRRIMTGAMESGRRVFFLIQRQANDPKPHVRISNEPKNGFPGSAWVRRFATKDKFDVEVAAAWVTSVVRPQQESTTRSQRRQVQVRVDRRTQTWQLVEVFTRPPPPPAPPRPAPPPPQRKPATTRAASTRPHGR